jgi:trehalose synthase
VVLHDPQAAGLAPVLADLGAVVIWNCHIGADRTNERAWQAWRFLLPSVTKAKAQVFSRRQYAWDGLEAGRVEIIPPCIDAFSPKNQALDPAQVDAILASSGIVESEAKTSPIFTRRDGRQAEVLAETELIGAGPIPNGVPVVSQVSRWDPLKDHSGLALGFSMGVPNEARLVLAGPSPEWIADDPEGAATLKELRECVESLPTGARERTHIACLPMDDIEQNAAIVNALQRRSSVVVQKSLAEGFGLTVAEAMWKARPTVASAVGGISDQIVHGSSGMLIEDPKDGAAFGRAITHLLLDPTSARNIGRRARLSVIEHYLAPTYLRRYLALMRHLLQD